MKPSLAILGASAVQDDAVLTAQSMGIEVHVLAAASNGPAATSADEFAPIDFSDVDAVTTYAAEHQLTAVYSTGSDLAIPVSADVSSRLDLPSFVSLETARTCNVKTDMRLALDGLDGNVPSLLVRPGDTVAWQGNWPTIVKPADSQGQRGVSRVDGPNELPSAIDNAMEHSRSQRVIIEEFIAGPEVSVNGYLVDGKLTFLAVSDRETWPEHVGLISSHVIPSKHANDIVTSRIRLLMETAAQTLGIHDGPVYAQVILREGHPFIIEITPRLDGCHMWKVIKHSTGVDLMKWTLEHLVFGKAPQKLVDVSERNEVRLDFHCQPPNTVFTMEEFVSPPDSVDSYSYYRNGDQVRPVNGRFEKVGYDIRVS